MLLAALLWHFLMSFVVRGLSATAGKEPAVALHTNHYLFALLRCGYSRAVSGLTEMHWKKTPSELYI